MRSILDLAALNVLKNNLSVTIDKFSDHLIEGFLKLMSKVNLNNITAGYGSVDLLNENFDAIAEAFDNTLSRNGAVPNTWLATQDANHQRLINLADPIDGKDAANKDYVVNSVVDATPISFSKAAYYVDRFTGDGTDTTFSLTVAPGLGTNSQVYINGAYQNKNTYSVSGTTITFTEAPPLDSSIECVVVTPVAPEVNAAANITIADAGGYYTSGNVEGALQEVMVRASQQISVKDFGAVGDGVTDDTDAFTNARNAGNGKYYIPEGTYLVDASPDVWLDEFTADNGAALKISGTTYDISNAICSAWKLNVDSPEKMSLIHAVTGDTLTAWQDGSAGTATYFYRTVSIGTDSHFLQVYPATNGGSTDLLFTRSPSNADPYGNRFNLTFEESVDRLLLSYATTSSGSPSFDSAMRVYAGTSPSIDFPALQPRFSQGWRVTTRTDGNFALQAVPSTDRAHLKNTDATKTYITFKDDGSVGFFGNGGITQPAITGSRGGNVALTNLLTSLSQLGLIIDNTSA